MSYHMKYQIKTAVACSPQSLPHMSARPRAACAKETHEASRVEPSSLGPAPHVAAKAPYQSEGRFDSRRRKTFQQPLLAAPHDNIQRVEQRPSLLREIHLDAAGVF